MLKSKLKSKKISSSIVAIIILVLLLICAFVLFFQVNNYRNIKSEKDDFYYYFASQRIDFNGKITINAYDNVISLKNPNITLTSSPVYYKNNPNQMILPKNMEIVFPYKTNPMYKLGSYAKVYFKGKYLYTNAEAGFGRLYDCFLYDGEDLYAFLDNTTIYIGDKAYSLSAMSFIEVTNNYIQIYNKSTNESIYIDKYAGDVTAYSGEYLINLKGDTFTYNNFYYLLIKNIDGLDLYEF